MVLDTESKIYSEIPTYMDNKDSDARGGHALTAQIKRSDPADTDPSLGLELGDQAAPGTRRFLELLLRGAYLQTQPVGGGNLRERVLWLTRDTRGQPVLAIDKRKTRCLASDARVIPMYEIRRVCQCVAQTRTVEIRTGKQGEAASGVRVALPSVEGAAIFVRRLRELLAEMGVDVRGDSDGLTLL